MYLEAFKNHLVGVKMEKHTHTELLYKLFG